MTDISEESRSRDRAAEQGEPRITSMWSRFLLLAATGVVVAGFGFFGYSTLYCRDLGGTLFWTIFMGVGGTAIAAVNSPELFWSTLLAFVAVVFIVSRYTNFRLTWSRFAIGIVAGYTVAALITWIFVHPGPCGLA